jgi:uncharacterized protein YecT (DUF1311 family)
MALVLSASVLPSRAQDKVPATTEAIAALQQSQRLWVQYRDLNAAAYQTSQSSRKVIKDQYYYYGATVITRSRIADLKTLFLND